MMRWLAYRPVFVSIAVMRDDFTPKVKKTVAERVSHECSKPDCRAGCIGPHTDPQKALRTGVAAHICAASPGGPRYDPNQTREERRNISNAIWLCRTCAELVDGDEALYPAQMLRDWRQAHEEEMRVRQHAGRAAERQGFLLAREAGRGAEEHSLAELEEAEARMRSLDHSIALVLLERLRQPEKWASLEALSKYKVLANIGIIEQARGRLAEAASLFIDAKAYAPSREKARCFEALAYSFLGDDATATRLAREILMDHPDATIAWSILIRDEASGGTLESLEQSIPPSILKDGEVAASLSHKALSLGRLENAIAYARTAYADCPESPEVWISLAHAILCGAIRPLSDSDGQWLSPRAAKPLEECIELYSRALDKYGEHWTKERVASLLQNRAVARRASGDEAGFEKDVERAHEMAPTLVEPTICLASHVARKGLFDRAVELLRPLAADGDPRITRVLAETLLQRGTKADLEQVLGLIDDEKSGATPDCGDRILVFMAQLGLGQVDAATQTAAGISELHSCVSLMLQAIVAERTGETEKCKDALLSAFKRRRELRETNVRVSLAHHLQRIGMVPEALEVWQDFVTAETFGPHTLALLYCAQRAGEDRVVLDMCKRLRESGFEERSCIDIEAYTLTKYGEQEQAIQLLSDAIDKAPKEETKRLLRVRLSLIGLQSDRSELVEHDASRLPDPATVDPATARYVIGILRSREPALDAAAYAYKIIRREFDNANAHIAMITSFIPGWGCDPAPPASETVQPGFAAYFEGEKQEFYIIENDAEPVFERRELKTTHPIALELIGKRVGAEVNLNPNGMQTHIVRIKEIVHKYVARMRDSSSRWEARFPESPFIWSIHLRNDANGQPDFGPIFRQLDRKAEAFEAAERLYQEGSVPVGFLSTLFGGTVIDAVAHVASTKHLRLNCAFGSLDEAQRAKRILSDQRQVVLEPTALATIFLFDLGSLLDHVNVVISHGTLGMLRELIADRSRDTPRGTMGKRDGKYFVQDFSTEQMRLACAGDLARAEALLARIEARADVRSSLGLVNFEPAALHDLERAITRAGAESVAIARDSALPLWTDDLPVALLAARNGHTAGYVWSSAVSAFQVGLPNWSTEQHTDTLVKLIQAGYTHTSMSPDVVLAAAKSGEWDPDRPPLTGIVDEFRRPQLLADPLAKMLLGTMRLLWREQVIEGQASRVVERIIERVSERPGAKGILAQMESGLDAAFGLDVVGCRAARYLLHSYGSSARIILP